jgi:serine phosphatase RsbU (regulator of sigma subunit)
LLTPEQWGVGGSEHSARLQLLAEATALLAATETVEEVGDVVVDRIAPVVGAAVAVLLVRDGDELVLRAARGVSAASMAAWLRFGVDADTPAGLAAREGRTVVVSGHDELNRLFPALQGAAPRDRTLVCVPMSARHRPLGVLAFGFDSDWPAPQYELDFFAIFAECGAQTISRIEASAAAAARARQLAFLADASEELSRSLEYRVTLQKVAELAVPDLADWCAVTLLEDGQLRSVAVAHKDPAKAEWAREFEQRYPPRLDAPTGPGNVVRTGMSELHRTITDEMLVASAVDEEHLRLARELQMHSALVVPLAARGHVLGVITMIRAETPGEYGPEDLALAEDLARRAAIAIDNALLYKQTQDIAVQLQRAVLPERLDLAPDWQVAAHSRPGDHAEVGGDFYDAFLLSPTQLVVFVGDVMGHGVSAAAAMATMRAAIRAFASVDPAPEIVVRKLDRMFLHPWIDKLVSLVYAVLDAEAAQLTFVNAGHHSPILVAPDGTAQVLHTPPARPLGAGGDDRAATVAPLRSDDTLLLYTDGLIERRGEVIDTGIARLVSRASALTVQDLDGALRTLVDEFEPNPDDDVTAIAVRRGRV